MSSKGRSGEAVLSSRRRRSGVVFGPLAWFAAFCLVIYSVVVIISQQVQIVKLKQEQNEIGAQITEARQQNDEYTRMLASDDESAYMEKVAVEKLGYAYPNERRFYVVDTH